MKLQPLNLEELARDVFDIFDDEEFDLTVSNIKSLIKQRLKSACMFYLRYRDKPGLLMKEQNITIPKSCITGKYTMPGNIGIRNVISWNLNAYNDWLFRLCFKPVLEDDKK